MHKAPRLFLATILLLLALHAPCAGQSTIRPQTGIFGLWAWGDWNEAFQIVSENGFEIAVGVSTREMLDLAHRRELRCIVDHGLTVEVAGDDQRWEAYLSGLEKKVRELRNHPAVFAWYPVDEPDWQKIPLDKVRQIRQLIRSLDPDRPIFTVLTLPEAWEPYIPYFDIVAVDPYLKVKGTGGKPDTPEKVAVYLSKLRADLAKAQLDRPVFAVLGAFDTVPRRPDHPRIFRKPTPVEMEEMIRIALEHRVDGILFWTLAYKDNNRYLDWRLPEDPLWETVRRLPASLYPKEGP